jgi:hypothetical protein
VVHAEGHWANKDEPLLLYLPLADPRLNKWFKSEPPTMLYLYLYPPGSLAGDKPPTVSPDLFQGEITTHSRRAITGMPVNCQIPDLTLPQLHPVPSGNIPERRPGVVAQAVGILHHVGITRLPVYVQGQRPNTQVEPDFENLDGAKALSGAAINAPVTIRRYFTPASIRAGSFVFRDPVPHYFVTIKVPGDDLYPIPADQIVRSFLVDRELAIVPEDEEESERTCRTMEPSYRNIEIQVDDAQEGMRFVYPVSFVFSGVRGG